MKFEQSSTIRETIAANLDHRRFMQMAAQVMAEFDKIDEIFAKCLGTAPDQKMAA